MDASWTRLLVELLALAFAAGAVVAQLHSIGKTLDRVVAQVDKNTRWRLERQAIEGTRSKGTR